MARVSGFPLGRIVALALVASAGLLLTSTSRAGTPRDLSSPSSRLVGHWANEDGTHYYFGLIDPKTDTGSLIWVEESADGRVVKHRYKIISETPRGEQLTIQILFGAGGSRVDPYIVASHGRTMTSKLTVSGLTLEQSYDYVDERTAPD